MFYVVCVKLCAMCSCCFGKETLVKEVVFYLNEAFPGEINKIKNKINLLIEDTKSAVQCKVLRLVMIIITSMFQLICNVILILYQ